MLAVAALCFAAACGPGTSDSTPLRPNLLLISVDTLRADHLSSSGYARATSPFLDGLAAEGIRFERAYSTSSWTTPAVVSMLTSTYPNHHGMGVRLRGVPRVWSRIPDALPSLAESLQRSGYRTFGLAANANLPPDRGFDRGFDRYICLGTADLDVVDRTITPWLEEINSDEGPWFLWLHMLDPHGPYDARKPWIDSFDPDHVRFRWLDGMPSEVFANRAPKLQPRHIEVVRTLYDSEIRATDEFLRTLFDRLAGAHDAFTLFTSDHGEEFLDHGGTLHGQTLFEELIRVPFIVRLPDRRLSGTVVRDNVSLVDVVPTLLGAAGIEPDERMVGINLIGPDGIAAIENRVVVSELLRGEAERAAIDRRWKLIYHEGRPQAAALYDLQEDPRELSNLAATHPDQVERLKDLLATFERHNPPIGTEAAPVEISAEEIEALRALGYVGTE